MSNLPRRIDAATLPEFVKLIKHSYIGLDDLMTGAIQPASNYPPYNLIRTAEDNYEIVMAIAGFSREEIEIEVEDRELTIRSIRSDLHQGSTYHPGATFREMNNLPEGAEILHQGLAMRDFSRTFKLVEYIEVTGAELKDGLLTVKLSRIIPDTAKPKLIEIK